LNYSNQVHQGSQISEDSPIKVGFFKTIPTNKRDLSFKEELIISESDIAPGMIDDGGK
jgi:hypothetical protein